MALQKSHRYPRLPSRVYALTREKLFRQTRFAVCGEVQGGVECLADGSAAGLVQVDLVGGVDGEGRPVAGRVGGRSVMTGVGPVGDRVGDGRIGGGDEVAPDLHEGFAEVRALGF